MGFVATAAVVGDIGLDSLYYQASLFEQNLPGFLNIACRVLLECALLARVATGRAYTSQPGFQPHQQVGQFGQVVFGNILNIRDIAPASDQLLKLTRQFLRVPHTHHAEGVAHAIGQADDLGA